MSVRKPCHSKNKSHLLFKMSFFLPYIQLAQHIQRMNNSIQHVSIDPQVVEFEHHNRRQQALNDSIVMYISVLLSSIHSILYEQEKNNYHH